MNLELAVAIAPFMQDFFDDDIVVIISGLKRVVVAINYNYLDLGSPIDEITNEKSITFQCLREKERLVLRVPMEKSQNGISYIAIANPLWNNGELEGVMTVVISDKRYDALSKSDASIEAACTGDKDRDFLVVTDEVDKLSERAKRSALAIFEDVIEVNVSEQFN